MDRVIRSDRFRVYDAYNPVIGTGLLMGLVTAFDPLSAFLSHWNPATSKVNTVPMQARLRVSNVGVATAGLEVALVLDTIDRHTAGGTPLTPVDRRVGKALAGVAEIHAGALTLAAAGADAQRLAHRVLKSAALTLGDEFLLDFGQGREGSDLGKMVVEPGYNLVLHAWTPGATTAPQFEAHWHFRETQVRTL